MVTFPVADWVELLMALAEPFFWMIICFSFPNLIWEVFAFEVAGAGHVFVFAGAQFSFSWIANSAAMAAKLLNGILSF